MKIAVVGCGYVGLVTGVCLAKLGHHVTMIDIDEERVDKMTTYREPPFYEPGLAKLMRDLTCRLTYSSHHTDVINKDAVVLAVGTPSGGDVRDEMQYFYEAVNNIKPYLSVGTIVIIKSTVLPGTNAKVNEMLVNREVISNPEFLREGSAVKDTLWPDRIVIGSRTIEGYEFMLGLYDGIEAAWVYTNPESAEMIKYASNAFLAMKISFINEIACICERAGADVYQVRRGMAADSRIGDKFLEPGVGYGGSCFPKDVVSLANFAREIGVDPPTILDAIDSRNQEQKYWMIDKIVSVFGHELKNAKIAVLGLAFKPNTDDTRLAPSLTLIHTLKECGAEVVVHDPKAKCPIDGVVQTPSVYDAIKDAHAAVIMTEWPEYRTVDWDQMYGGVLFDGRGVYRDYYYHIDGIDEYYCVGVGSRMGDG